MGLAHPKYRADIDGLRAIAVFSVIGFHAFPNWIKGGFIGVDIFFVISGFLISTIIFGSLERNNFSFFEFYSRRIRRIFPALLLVLSVSYLLGWFVLLADEYKQLGMHIAGGAGFVSNFVLLNERGYFDTTAETKPLLHLWSLGIEEQFYIVWPVLLWGAYKLRLNLLTVTVVIAVISFVLNIDKINNDTVLGFYAPQTRFWELLVGSALAYCTLYKQTVLAKLKQMLAIDVNASPVQVLQVNRHGLRNCQSLVGVLLLTIGIMLITKKSHFPGWWALLPTLGTAFIISAGAKAWINRNLLAHPVLVWFGLISFPLYLWHWPLLSFARIVEGERSSDKIQMAAVLLSIALAWLTYKLVEKPLRFGPHGKAKTLILLALMAIMGSVGYYCFENNGLYFRLKKNTENKDVSYEPVFVLPCARQYPMVKGNCRLSRPYEYPPRVALVGDSHSTQYYIRLAEYLENTPMINIIGLRCLPFSSAAFQANPYCKKNYITTLAFLTKQESIKTVYLAGYWSYLISGGATAGGDGWRVPKPLKPAARISFQKNAEVFIAALIAAKKEVILIRDIPDLDFNIKSCIRPFTLTKKNKTPCAHNVARYKKRNSSYDAALLEVTKKFPTLKIFDPRPLFCDKVRCWGIKNGEVLYSNGDHLTKQGAALVVKELMSQYPVD